VTEPLRWWRCLSEADVAIDLPAEMKGCGREFRNAGHPRVCPKCLNPLASFRPVEKSTEGA
jgi:hypothetical protein